jgi:small-conductance mechanosensitive channel
MIPQATKFWSTWQWLLQPVGVFLGATIAALLLHSLLVRLVKRFGDRTGTELSHLAMSRCRNVLRWLALFVSLYLFMPLVRISDNARGFLYQGLGLAVILSLAWFCVKFLGVLESFFLSRYDLDARDNLRARAMHTQIRILKKVVIVILAVITTALVLMTFSKVRQVGTSILASAGILGIIIGFAAQRSISTLIAGVQIALTQPIRLDDVVVIENEWGRIEDITLTYVVVRIWDLRRLVLPITYFLEKPFQNWTRISADILGTVFLQVDYSVPVGEVREELGRILEASKLWDGKVGVLQVTDAKQHTMELRALVSAPDSSRAWELRCKVREELIAFLQKKYPHCLPKVRAQLEGLPERLYTAVKDRSP